MEGERGKVLGGICTCGPSTCCCLTLSCCPPLQGQAGGAASSQGSTSKGCPLEQSQQGHSPAGHGADVDSVCWDLGAPRADSPHAPSPQVIYKKFQIPCPLPEQEGNITGILNATTVSTSDYQNGYTVLQAPEQVTCTPSFFTLNSQVRMHLGCTLEALGEPLPRAPHEDGWSWCWQHLPLGPQQSVVLLLHRQRTPSPSWPSPLSATLRSCPSTPS